MNWKDKILTACAALLACAVLGTAAKAEENPCKADKEKFCKDVQPGEGRIIKCLKEHEAELSAGCKAKGDELKKKADELKEACQADLDKFCKDIQPGEGRLAKCLKEHNAELSKTCSKKIAEEKEAFMKGHPCMADMEKFCKAVEPGEGRKIKCMKEHEAELSAECRAKIAEKTEEFKKNSPCGPDIEKFCKDVKPGEGRIIYCLKAHEPDLSAECKAESDELKEKAGELKKACQADLDKFCKDVKQGEGRLIQCLKEHEKELSAGCTAKIAANKEQRQGKIKEQREEIRENKGPKKRVPAPAKKPHGPRGR
ncbi:MAG: cysteine rich repeat-containing protein [Elusimicrobia bacterium]|nr:cysteine rich repeat-containing protein [Elusimicrobiota bacterium]